jgi:hypothetical protein
MKKRKILLSVFFLGAFALSVSAFFAVRCTYVPESAVAKTEKFVSLVRHEKFEEAYSLVGRTAETGTDFSSFMKKISVDLPMCKSDEKLVLRYVHPAQTYGNRIRRRLNGRRVDMERINLDYLLCGEIPFRVTLSSDAGGNWTIVNFQVHAE